MAKKSIPLYLSDEQHVKLKEIAVKKDISRTKLVEREIVKLIKKETK